MVTPTVFWSVVGILAALLVWQELMHLMQTKRLGDEKKDLMNRLAAKDLTEYAGATRSLAPPEKADNTSEWTEEEIERARDRIPIN